YRDAESLLEERDHFEDAGRIDDAALDEGRVVAEVRSLGDIEVLDDEGADLLLAFHLHTNPVFLIFPVAVFGSSSRTSTCLGTMKSPSRDLPSRSISFAVSVTPFSRTTNAFTA